MRVRDVMRGLVISCGPGTPVRELSWLMLEHDCGSLPVIEATTGDVVGIITDRDIVLRAVAWGQPTNMLRAEDLMSRPVVTIAPDAALSECASVMAGRKVRRLPVIDRQGRCCGIISRSDLARLRQEREFPCLPKRASMPFYAAWVTAGGEQALAVTAKRDVGAAGAGDVGQ